jgi:hypothetical protein
MLIARSSDAPTFSRLCGGSGADHRALSTGIFAVMRLSPTVAPFSSGRTKSLRVKPPWKTLRVSHFPSAPRLLGS